MESPKKELRVLIPKDLYDNFKKECKSKYKTMSEVIRDFILKYKAKNDK